MKSKNTQSADANEFHVGLAALGRAGAWDVALDETVVALGETFEGPQRWFVQIEGPAFYIYFEIHHPRIIDESVTFLNRHLCPDNSSQGSASPPDRGDELELSHFGDSVVSLIWDSESNQRCFILIRGTGEFRARLCIERSDLQELTDALEQMRDELSEEGVLT